MDEKRVRIPKEHAGKRLDWILARLLPSWSRTKVQELFEKGLVEVEGRNPQGKDRLPEGTEVRILVLKEEKIPLRPRALPLEIVYMDEAVLVVNKPSGLIVHPAKTADETTLLHALLPYFQEEFPAPERMGIVHRLDKETSGLLLVARTNRALEKLQADLREKTVERTYLALVEGLVPHERGKIDAPVGRNEKKRHLMAVTAKGKASVTRFTVKERFEKETLLRLDLETGRTHQIRVHLDYIGHPVVGDPHYGRKKTDTRHGQFLHAFRLVFPHPDTGEKIATESPLPFFFQKRLQENRQK